jgi:hypothetical protein
LTSTTAKPRLVKNWISGDSVEETCAVGPPCTRTISGGRSSAGAVKSGLCGG